MRILNALLRAYASLYHFLAGAFLAGLAIVAYKSGLHNINTGGMTTLAGETLSQTLLAIGLVGMALAVVAIFGKLRWLFVLYCLAAVVMIFRWFFLSPYKFDSEASFRTALWIFAGAVIALLCSLLKPYVRRHGMRHARRR